MTSTPTNPLMSAEEVRRQDIANSQPLPAAIDKGKARRSDPQKIEDLRVALEAVLGHMLNATIGLETGDTKRAAVQILEGGMVIARQVLKETA